MTRHKKIDVDTAIAEMLKAAGPGGDWAAWHGGPGARLATLEFAAGELTNKAISGYVWAWNMLGKLKTGLAVDCRDRLSAHGLEGKCRVTDCLVTCLLAAREMPRFRRAIYAGGTA